MTLSRFNSIVAALACSVVVYGFVRFVTNLKRSESQSHVEEQSPDRADVVRAAHLRGWFG